MMLDSAYCDFIEDFCLDIVLPFSCAVRNTTVLDVPKTTRRFKDALEVSKDSACSHTHGGNLLQREDTTQRQQWESHMGSKPEAIKYKFSRARSQWCQTGHS